MLSSLSTFINEKIGFDGSMLKSRKSKKEGMCRYECLDAKKQSESKPKKRVSFEAKPAAQNNVSGDGEEKRAMKFKILMTKEEAARLLSKCKDGGVIEFEEVARELAQFPHDRVRLVSSSGNRSNDYSK